MKENTPSTWNSYLESQEGVLNQVEHIAANTVNTVSLICKE